MDIRAFPDGWDVAKRLGPYTESAEVWHSHSVLQLASQLCPKNLALIVDCGIGDVFIDVNHRLHEEFIGLSIPHDYIERPGGHDPGYWNFAIQVQMHFFHSFFKSPETASI